MPPSSRRLVLLLRRPPCLRPLRAARSFAAAPRPRATTPSHAIKAEKVKLREYQEECIQAVLSHLHLGHKRLGVSLATGSGKTVIFTQLIDRVAPPSDQATQTLILAHRQELVEQAARHCTNAYPGKRIEIEMGNIHASGFADITVASVQSIISGDRISKFDPRRFKLVLVDEAHHIVAPGYMKTLSHFGLLEPCETSPALVGVSATLSRLDGLKLGAALDHIVYHKDYVDMIDEKWLSPVLFTTVQSGADISKVKKGANGDFALSELSRAVNKDEINDTTVRSWLTKAEKRESTIVFCSDLAHVHGLTNKFRQYGIDARFVTGDTPKAERSSRLEAFKRREFPVIVNCGVFIEGTDAPNIDCVLLARPTKSRNLLVQMIGRGMRLYPGKKDCHIIDMVASLATGIVTVPTLFGLDPREMVDDATPSDMRERQQRQEDEAQRQHDVVDVATTAGNPSSPKNVTFVDYDSVLDLIRDTSGDRYIRALSQHTWVEVGDNRFILSSPDGRFLRLERLPQEHETVPKCAYVVTETQPVPASMRKTAPLMKPREITRSPTFEGAVTGADTYAAKKYPHVFISRHQHWRSRPATEAQLTYINKVRKNDAALSPADVNMGQATDMITKIKHGARGRFAKAQATRRRQDRAQQKIDADEELRRREDVRVGPIADA